MKKKKRTALLFILSVALILPVISMTVFASVAVNTGGTELISGNNYVPSVVRTAQSVHSLSFPIIGGDEVMPIGAWYGPFTPTGDTIDGVMQPDFISDKYFELIKASGVNFFAHNPNNFVRNRSSVLRTLELADKYGIGMFVEDSVVNNIQTPAEMESRMNEYFSYDSCVGVHIADEPNASLFDGIAKTYEMFDQTVYAPSKHLYTNLFPSYAGSINLTGATLGAEGESLNYEEYLRRFVQKSGTKFLSYDNYPFSRRNQGVTNGIPSTYFGDLSTARKVALSESIPLWTFVQAGWHWEGQRGKPTASLLPDEAETLWNINTSLAYGAKAIQYFCLIQPDFFANTGTGFDYSRGSMLGAAGNINQWYYYIQKANKQISAIDHILMRSTNMGVLATGFWSNRLLADRPAGAGAVSWRELTNITSSATDGVIVGCFDYNFSGSQSRSALYIVNSSSTEKQTATLTFNKKYGYDVIQRGVSIGVTGQSVTLTLEKGEGVMLALR